MTANSTWSDVIATTEAPVSTAYADDLWKWVVYTISGTLNVCLNVPVVATVARFTALNTEKQYVIVAGLALADTLNGLGYLTCGAYRSYVVVVGTFNDKISAWSCLLRPHNLLWIWTDTAATLMLLVVSSDRLLSVIIPLRYLRLHREYALTLVAAAFGYSLGSGVVGGISSYMASQKPNKAKVCYMGDATGSGFYGYYGSANTLFAFGSIAVFIALGVVARLYYRKKLQQLVGDKSSKLLQQQSQQQRKMTISLGISCLFTFFFYCIPYCIGTYVAVYLPQFPYLATYMWMLTTVNPMLNTLIYLWRHREIRKGVVALCTCKQMAPHLRSWLDAPQTDIQRVSQVTNVPRNIVGTLPPIQKHN